MSTHQICSLPFQQEEYLRDISEAIYLERERLIELGMSEDEMTSHLARYVYNLGAEKLRDIVKKDMQIKTITDNFETFLKAYPDKKSKEAIRSFLQVNTYHSKNSRVNVESMTLAKRQELEIMYYNALENIKDFADKDKTILSVFNPKDINVTKEDGKMLNNDIMKALAKLHGIEVDGEINTLAMQYAEAIFKVKNHIKKNITQEKDLGHFTQQTHNKDLLKSSGFDNWYKSIKDKIDLNKQPFMRNEKIARNVYENLLDNKSGLEKIQVPIGLKKSLNEFEKSRNFDFKQVDDHIFYENNFGSSISEIQKFYFTIDKTARDYGFKKVIGDQHKSILESLIKYAKQDRFEKDAKGNIILDKDGRPKTNLSLTGAEATDLRNLYDELRGLNKVANEDYARIGADIRKVSNTTLFGRVWATTTASDKVVRGLALAMSGEGNILSNTIFGVFKGLQEVAEVGTKGTLRLLGFKKLTKEQRERLEDFGIAGNSLTAGFNRYVSREISTEQGGRTGGKVANWFSAFADKSNRVFTKLSYLDTFEEVSMRSVITQEANIVFKSLTEKNWDALNPKRKEKFVRYGIQEEEFNLLKLATQYNNKDKLQGLKLFSANSVLSLTDEEISKYASKQLNNAKTIEKLTGITLEEKDIKQIYDNVRQDLSDKIRTMYNGEAHIVLGKRDSRSNNLIRGTQSGTIGGEATRFFMQAKSYPIIYWENVVQNLWRSSEAGSTLNKTATTAGFMLLSAIVGGSWSYISSSLLNNKEPEKLTKLINGEASTEEVMDFIREILVRSGVFGIFGDVLATAGGGEVLTNVLGLGLEGVGLVDNWDYNKLDKRGVGSDVLSFLSGPAISKVSNVLAESVNAPISGDVGNLLQAVKNIIPSQNTMIMNFFLNSVLELNEDYADLQERRDMRADRSKITELLGF